MTVMSDILTNRMFWASYLSTQWAGSVVSRAWPYGYEFGFQLFGLSYEECNPLWNQFTRWHKDVFNESDGYVNNPGRFTLSLPNSVTLRIDVHPGGMCYYVSQGNNEQLLGAIGPHYQLPALRWSEAESLSRSCTLEGMNCEDMHHSFAILLLLPVVWLTEDDQIDGVRSVIEDAWLNSEIATRSAASRFTQECTNAMDVGSRYHWWKERNLGWVTDSSWSVRFVERNAEAVKSTNNLLRAPYNA